MGEVQTPGGLSKHVQATQLAEHQAIPLSSHIGHLEAQSSEGYHRLVGFSSLESRSLF